MKKQVHYRTFANFEEAHKHLLSQGFVSKGQDGCLNHLYENAEEGVQAKGYGSWGGFEVQFS